MTANSTQTPDLLNNIIENAFDFLVAAIEEFDTKPKFSIMHFSIAIELVLKARLVHEHWSLIVDDKPEKAGFMTGDFRSITLKESIERIRKVLGEDLHKDYQDAFLQIAKHRNKLVHFFHHQVGKDTLSLEESIAREQCIGWLYLSRLIKRWDDIFIQHQDQVTTLHDKMAKHRYFLFAVYETIKPDINKEALTGVVFKDCPSCGFKAWKQSILTDNIHSYTCKVCHFAERIIIIACPECSKFIEVAEGDADLIKCTHCEHEINHNYLSTALDTDPITSDNYYEHPQINCADCYGRESVISHHDYYICTKCRNISQTIGYCRWCSEGQMGGGDLEFSYYGGCEFCEGNAGHIKDD